MGCRKFCHVAILYQPPCAFKCEWSLPFIRKFIARSGVTKRHGILFIAHGIWVSTSVHGVVDTSLPYEPHLPTPILKDHWLTTALCSSSEHATWAYTLLDAHIDFMVGSGCGTFAHALLTSVSWWLRGMRVDYIRLTEIWRNIYLPGQHVHSPLPQSTHACTCTHSLTCTQTHAHTCTCVTTKINNAWMLVIGHFSLIFRGMLPSHGFGLTCCFAGDQVTVIHS